MRTSTGRENFDCIHVSNGVNYVIGNTKLTVTAVSVVGVCKNGPTGFLSVNNDSGPVGMIRTVGLLLRSRGMGIILVGVFKKVAHYSSITVKLVRSFRRVGDRVPVVIQLAKAGRGVNHSLLQGRDHFRVTAAVRRTTLVTVGSWYMAVSVGDGGRL